MFLSRSNSWPIAAATAAVAVWIAWDPLTDIVHVAATNSEASHIWLVPVVFVWLAATRWRRPGQEQPTRIRRGVGGILVAVAVTLWWTGYRFQVQSAWHLGAVLMVAGGVLFGVGDFYLWWWLPAWVVLVFLVPVPARVRFFVAQPLETMTAAATQSVSEVLGMAVMRSGNQLTVNGVAVSVAEACNGVRLVFTLFLACYVAVFVRPYRWWVRAVVLAASPVVAVMANVARLVPTMWVFGHHTPDAAERFHDIAGAVMVLVAFLGLTACCSLLDWAGLPVMVPGGLRPKLPGKSPVV